MSEGVPDAPFVVIPHPMGMIAESEITKKAENAFLDIVTAATEWKSTAKLPEMKPAYPAERVTFKGSAEDGKGPLGADRDDIDNRSCNGVTDSQGFFQGVLVEMVHPVDGVFLCLYPTGSLINFQGCIGVKNLFDADKNFHPSLQWIINH